VASVKVTPIAMNGQRRIMSLPGKKSSSSDAGICSQLFAESAGFSSSGLPTRCSTSGRNALVVK
jgi:hypothetical protein